MAHTIEPAASGRAKCRGCGEKIAKDELRLGARLPNPFAEEELLTLWFHLACGAYKRPQAYLDAVPTAPRPIEDAERLEAEAKRSLDQRRLPRLDGASRAPTGRAKCRSCKESIDKGTWRIGLVFYDEEQGRFEPGGFIHPKCAEGYFGTRDIVERLARFSPSLEAAEIDELRAALE